MKIADIKISDRARKNLGDICSLTRSIEAVGLLHPIVVCNDGTLIAGARRIAAFVQLGRTEIPHTVVDSLEDALTLLLAERDENTERKDFTPSEAVAMSERLEPLERKAAKERQRLGQEKGRATQHGKPVGEKFSPTTKAKTADQVASAVGMSRPTLAKAKAVLDAARRDPEHCNAIAEEMDKTGNVHGAYKKLTGNAFKAQLRQLAEESQAEFEQATAWMSEEQKAALSTEMMRQRGELSRLVEDIAERLGEPAAFAERHSGYIHQPTIINCELARTWLGRFLAAWRSNGQRT